MSLNTSLEAIFAAIGVEIAKLVVEKYKNKKSVKEDSKDENEDSY